ncbi:MAG: C-GCAxxG-C-C family protein [Lachnospiraceae bacterium]
MSRYLDRAAELRQDPNRHYNCAQAVLIPFAEAKGISKETANALTANFGSGMRAGLTCGAITGGLMALGLCGAGDPSDAQELIRRIKQNHAGMTDCAHLLAANTKTGTPKKVHCDAMVYEAVKNVEQMLADRGLLNED